MDRLRIQTPQVPYSDWTRKLILFEKLNIVVNFPQIPNSEEVQILWRELLKNYRLLSVRPCELSEQTNENFERKSKDFVRMLTSIYPAKHVTPYMHAMMMHVNQFMEIHGAILPHGLEKYNNSMTKDYFRSSSHRGQCLVQILQKQNSLKHLEHTGGKREKRFSVTCGNCNEKGHNTISCKNCGHAPFCGHLVKKDSTRIPVCLE